MTDTSPLLRDSLPGLAGEVEGLLRESGRTSLADQVPGLRVHDRCRCEDEFCATVYTARPPQGSWGPRHENVVLEPANGMLVLDVVDGKVSCIEVLYRDDIREQVLKRFP